MSTSRRRRRMKEKPLEKPQYNVCSSRLTFPSFLQPFLNELRYSLRRKQNIKIAALFCSDKRCKWIQRPPVKLEYELRGMATGQWERRDFYYLDVTNQSWCIRIKKLSLLYLKAFHFLHQWGARRISRWRMKSSDMATLPFLCQRRSVTKSCGSLFWASYASEKYLCVTWLDNKFPFC